MRTISLPLYRIQLRRNLGITPKQDRFWTVIKFASNGAVWMTSEVYTTKAKALAPAQMFADLHGIALEDETT